MAREGGREEGGKKGMNHSVKIRSSYLKRGTSRISRKNSPKFISCEERSPWGTKGPCWYLAQIQVCKVVLGGLPWDPVAICQDKTI